MPIELKESIEGMVPTLTGIISNKKDTGIQRNLQYSGDIHSDNTDYPREESGTGYGGIITSEGERYLFSSQMCKDPDTFKELRDGMRVTFKKTTHTLNGKVATELVAHDVAIDTSKEASIIVSGTKSTFPIAETTKKAHEKSASVLDHSIEFILWIEKKVAYLPLWPTQDQIDNLVRLWKFHENIIYVGKEACAKAIINPNIPQVFGYVIENDIELENIITDKTLLADIRGRVIEWWEYPIVYLMNDRAREIYAQYLWWRIPTQQEQLAIWKDMPWKNNREKATHAGLPFLGWFDPSDHKFYNGGEDLVLWSSSREKIGTRRVRVDALRFNIEDRIFGEDIHDTRTTGERSVYGDDGTSTFVIFDDTPTTIKFYTEEALNLSDADLRTVFGRAYISSLNAKVENIDDSNKEVTTLFRKLFSKYMEQAPSIQSSMRSFFELVNFCTVSENKVLVNKNPLKKMLFAEKDISPQEWITGIIENFEKDSAQMIKLLEIISSADKPPLIWSKKFIRSIFDTRPEILESGDRVWLQELYTQWPDEEVTNKANTISNSDKMERNRIATKYLEQYNTIIVTPEAIKAVQDFMNSITCKR